MKKRAGVLCPIFSVPGNQGIGDFGQKTIRMIDAIAKAGYSIWQILPIQITGMSHSPYQTLSSFAGDPIYINLDRLSEMGLLTQSSIVNCNKFKDFVYYDEVRAFKEPYFKKAFKAFKKNYEQYEVEFKAFKKEAFWLEDWCTYALFKGLYDNLGWADWDDEYKEYPETHSIDLEEYEDDLLYIAFLQFVFYKQFDEISKYAKSKGIQIMGDVPFYVDYDSADVWMNRKAFLLNEEGEPEYIAGCPPDYFSEDGQRWGMPIYNFKYQKKTNYKFWTDRMKWMDRCFDIVRIDHFRAFDTYWKIPATCPTAREGKWILGPRGELIEAIEKACPTLELVAEDLGLIRPEVIELEDEYEIPGMDVLLFRMEAKLLKKPAKEHSILYTGTHDNATAEEDYLTYDSNKRISLRRFFKKKEYTHRSFHDMICHFAIDSKADTVILPIQDICGYKGNARINTPGTCTDQNWTWKLKDFKTFPDELMKTRPWLEQAGRIQK